VRLVYRVTPTQRLIIVESAVEQMLSFAQRRWWQCEAGGAMLGRHLLDTRDIVVDEVTTPQSGDRRSRFGFFRSKQHGEVARERWAAERQTMAYLGLWHTHPEANPTPSGADKRDWEQAVAGDAFEGDRLFFPIVGTDRMRIWTLNRRGALNELNLVETSGREGPRRIPEAGRC
jgi:integrative and conjugative element protein (TIGR02256 family)